MPGARGVTIEGVEAAAFRVPTDAPEADGTLAWDATVLVTCDIRAGGETGFGYGYADAATAVFLRDVLAPVLDGGDAFEIPALWRRMTDAVRNHGRQGIAAMAISVVDLTLHDLKAKVLGLPLARMLGQCRDAAPLYGSGGFLTYDDAQMHEQVEGWVSTGFEAVKIKVASDIRTERHRMSLAREASGDAALMIDANGACTRKGALALAQAAADYGVTYFEEPVSSDDIAGLRHIRDRAPAGMAIAAGEYGYDAFHLRALLEAGAVDILQADATRCGGVTGLLQADALAYAHNVPLSIHCAPAIQLHAALALQRLVHMEWFHDHARIEKMLLDGAPDPADGQIAPDLSRPGHGLQLKKQDAERYRLTLSEAA